MRYLLYILMAVLVGLPRSGLCQERGTTVVNESWQSIVKAAIHGQDWDEALPILDAFLDDSPEDMEARLLRAICHREKARHVFVTARSQFFLDPGILKDARTAAALSARGRSWDLEVGRDYDVTKAIFDFEYIVSRDSSFRDVLIEYARLWHDHDVFDLAIELGETQLRLGAQSPRVHEELIAIYRHYIAWTSTKNALETLAGLGSSYAQFFIGEVLRRDGRMQRADSIYSALQRKGSLPRELILLSRARLAVAQSLFEEAHAFINEALNFRSVLGGRLLLEDFKYVLEPREYAESRTLHTVEDLRDFHARTWARRNPLPASRLNWRLIEHYRRLVAAERDYEYFGPRVKRSGDHEDPNGFIDSSSFPPAYWETHGFNDKGLIYIRHGEPDERIVTQPKPNIGMNESWRYRAEELDFHFYISETDGIAYSWPLVPLLVNCYMAYDRREWGGFYIQLSPYPQFVQTPDPGRRTDPCGDDAEARNPHDVNIAVSYLADEGNADIARGLRTDRHTWIDEEMEPFGFPFDIATFRGADGLTDVSIFFALPVGFLGQESRRDTLSVEIGYALHDMSWRRAAGESFLKQYVTDHDRTTAAFETIQFRVHPDSFHVAMHADLIRSPLLSGYKLARRVPDYNRTETMMSDIVLAYDIRPKPGHQPSRRSSLQITANPFHRFTLDQIVHVYFELYHLGLDENDIARFDVTYGVTSEEEGGGLLDLLRRKKPSLSVSSAFEEATPSPIVSSEIDVSSLAPGAYMLTVRVYDRITRTNLTRRTPLELSSPASD